MPLAEEVRLYLGGLWMLIRGDEQGFRRLDMSDRGMMRSFWAFVWCLPAAFASWLWWRDYLLAGLPAGTRLGTVFFLRMAILEAFSWIVPLIFAGLLCALLGTERKFPAIVVCLNWLSVPFAYVSGLLSLRYLLPGDLNALLALAHLLLLVAIVVVVARLMRMICGPQPLMIATFVLVLFVPGMLLSEVLQRFLGIYPV